MIAAPELTQSAEEAIAESNRRFADAAARGDAGGMASVYAIDAELLPPNAEALRGPAAIEHFWARSIELGICGIEVETLRLVQAEGLAYEIGRYTLHVTAEAVAPVADVASYFVVHKRRRDGSWQRATESFAWVAPLTD